LIDAADLPDSRGALNRLMAGIFCATLWEELYSLMSWDMMLAATTLDRCLCQYRCQNANLVRLAGASRYLDAELTVRLKDTSSVMYNLYSERKFAVEEQE
jgi:hypothetical protein